MTTPNITLDLVASDIQVTVAPTWVSPHVSVRGVAVWHHEGETIGVPLDDMIVITSKTYPPLLNHFEWIMHGVDVEDHLRKIGGAAVMHLFLTNRITLPWEVT